MAKQEIQNGQAEYGVVHVMEEEMRAAEQGVFEPHSSEAGMKPRRKAEPAAAENKDAGASPANKAAVSAATAGSSSRQAAKRKGGK